MLRNLLLFAFCFVSSMGFAQSQLIGGSFIDYGVLNRGSATDGVLEPAYSNTSAIGLYGQFRFRNLFALETGIAQHRDMWRFRDAQFEEDYSAHNFIYKHRSNYLSYHGSLQFFIPLGEMNWLYAGASYRVALDRAETVSESYEYEILKSEADHTVIGSANFGERNAAVIPEIGYQTELLSGGYFSIGWKMDFSQSALVSGQYQLYDNFSNQLLRSDNFTASGNSWSFEVKLGIPLQEFKKRERSKQKPVKPDNRDSLLIVEKEKDPEEEEEEDEKEVSKTPPAKIERDEKGIPTRMNGREVVKSKVVQVQSDTLTIRVWDSGRKVDGDSISLNLNGDWILKDFRLKRQQHIFKIAIDPKKDNYLIMYALNLGTAPPNTAAIMVFDGQKTKVMRLESDMGTCGALKITRR